MDQRTPMYDEWLHARWRHIMESSGGHPMPRNSNPSLDWFIVGAMSIVDDIEGHEYGWDTTVREAFGIGDTELLDLLYDVRKGDTKALRILWLIGFDEGALIGAADGTITPDDIRSLLDRYEAGNARWVYRLHLEGFTPYEIADEVGCGRSRVYQILDEVGVNTNVVRRRISEDDRERMVTSFRAGKSFGTIAQEMAMPLSVVKGALRTAHRRGDFPEWGTNRGKNETTNQEGQS